MEKVFNNELWADLELTEINIHYLNDLRSSKRKVEPIYKGIMAIIAIITVILSILQLPPIYTTCVAAITALMSIFPMLFPIIATSADLAEFDNLRMRLRQKQIRLEEFWYGDRTEKELKNYKKLKEEHIDLDTRVYALFGKIKKKRNKYAQEMCKIYLHRFSISSALPTV